MNFFRKRSKRKRPVYPKTTYFDTWTKKKQRAYYEAVIASTKATELRATKRWLDGAVQIKALEQEIERLRGKK